MIRACLYQYIFAAFPIFRQTPPGWSLPRTSSCPPMSAQIFTDNRTNNICILLEILHTAEHTFESMYQHSLFIIVNDKIDPTYAPSQKQGRGKYDSSCFHQVLPTLNTIAFRVRYLTVIGKIHSKILHNIELQHIPQPVLTHTSGIQSGNFNL